MIQSKQDMRLTSMLLLLICRNYEDAYTDPGSPASRRTSLGTYVLAMVDNQKKLLMQGIPLIAAATSRSSLPTPCFHSDLTIYIYKQRQQKPFKEANHCCVLSNWRCMAWPPRLAITAATEAAFLLLYSCSHTSGKHTMWPDTTCRCLYKDMRVSVCPCRVWGIS